LEAAILGIRMVVVDSDKSPLKPLSLESSNFVIQLHSTTWYSLRFNEKEMMM